jgi:hypothetical protein
MQPHRFGRRRFEYVASARSAHPSPPPSSPKSGTSSQEKERPHRATGCERGVLASVVAFCAPVTSRRAISRGLFGAVVAVGATAGAARWRAAGEQLLEGRRPTAHASVRRHRGGRRDRVTCPGSSCCRRAYLELVTATQVLGLNAVRRTSGAVRGDAAGPGDQCSCPLAVPPAPSGSATRTSCIIPLSS